jgi:hypothetical protein
MTQPSRSPTAPAPAQQRQHQHQRHAAELHQRPGQHVAGSWRHLGRKQARRQHEPGGRPAGALAHPLAHRRADQPAKATAMPARSAASRGRRAAGGRRPSPRRWRSGPRRTARRSRACCRAGRWPGGPAAHAAPVVRAVDAASRYRPHRPITAKGRVAEHVHRVGQAVPGAVVGEHARRWPSAAGSAGPTQAISVSSAKVKSNARSRRAQAAGGARKRQVHGGPR